MTAKFDHELKKKNSSKIQASEIKFLRGVKRTRAEMDSIRSEIIRSVVSIKKRKK